jgi:hypothetical protein
MNFFGIPGLGTEYEKTSDRNLMLHLAIIPNPFTRSAIIRYQTNDDKPVSIKIFDASGRMVKEFAGHHIERNNNIVWGAEDNQGRTVPHGVYFVTITTPSDTKIKKIVHIK